MTPTGQLTDAQLDRLDHDKAYAKVVAQYQRDPAYWFDLMVKNWNKPVRKEAEIRLLRLGWEVIKVSE